MSDTRTSDELLEARPPDGTPEYEAWRLGALTQQRLTYEGMTADARETFDLAQSLAQTRAVSSHKLVVDLTAITASGWRWRARARLAGRLLVPNRVHGWWWRLTVRSASQQRTVTPFGLWGFLYAALLVVGLAVVGTDETVPQVQVALWFCGFAFLGIAAALAHRNRDDSS